MALSKDQLIQLSKDPRLTPEERRAALGMLQEALREPTEGWNEMSGWDKAGKLGDAVELGGGFIPNPAYRIPLVAAGGTLSAYSKGEDISNRLATQLALEAVFPGLSKGAGAVKNGVVGFAQRLGGGLSDLLPEAGLHAGLRFGGLKGDVGKAVDAFLRERQRGGWFGGILPGNSKKIAARKGAVGAELEAVETAAQGTGDLKAITDPALAEIRTLGTSEPHKIAASAVKNQRSFLRKPTQVKGFGPAGNPKHPSVREIGDIKRTQAREASGLIESRLSGASPYEPNAVAETMAAARSRLLRDAQEQMAPEVIPLNQHLSDLLSMQSVNKSLRGGGGIVQDVGGLGVRGGFGSGVGRAVAGNPGSKWGAILSLGLLSPKGSAAAGFAGGRAAEVTPSLMRILELMKEERERGQSGQ